MALTDPLRRGIADAVRSKVAGPNDGRREAIWEAPGPRWFAPGDPIWRVHCHPSMMVGGLRALLVQSLHPLAMAGVVGHSGFRGDPWGRLQRTSGFIATTTYAPVTDAERLLARIRGIHRQVNGVDDRGRPYAASDPHLLTWVHAAEADSFLTAFQANAAQPLSPDEADTYVAQIGTIAARLGVPEPPATTAALAEVIDGYRPELEASAAARDTVDFLLHDPPVTGATRLGYRPFVWGALAVLPTWARELLDLPAQSGPRRAAARLMVATLDWAIDHPADAPLPPGWRHERGGSVGRAHGSPG